MEAGKELDDTATSPAKPEDAAGRQVAPKVIKQLDMGTSTLEDVGTQEKIPPPPPVYVSPRDQKRRKKTTIAGASPISPSQKNKAASSEEDRREQ